jgi:D-threo-aldose 1-dehydrogenase
MNTTITVSLPRVIFGTSALGNLYVALADADKCAIVKECVLHSAKPVALKERQLS